MEIEFDYQAFSDIIKYKIIINKEILTFENNRQDYSQKAIQFFIKKCIDMDSWKHSWHKEIKSENYLDFIKIIQDKISDRNKELEILNFGLKLVESLKNE